MRRSRRSHCGGRDGIRDWVVEWDRAYGWGGWSAGLNTADTERREIHRGGRLGRVGVWMSSTWSFVVLGVLRVRREKERVDAGRLSDE